jgi:hypothetical protein
MVLSNEAMKLIALIFGTCVAVAMSLASVHFWGLSQIYIPYDNRFFQSGPTWLVVPWEQHFFAEKHPDLILYALVYPSQNQELLVAPTSEKTMKSRQREATASPARPLLTELLRQHPKQRFILNIDDNSEVIHELIGKALATEALSERIAIQSPYNNVLSSIKDLLPRMVYGSTPSDIMRLKSFDGMGILTATPFKGDLFFANLKLHQRQAITPAIAGELLRRNKKIILGPLTSIEEYQLALSLGAHGVFVEHPEWLLQELDKKAK